MEYTLHSEHSYIDDALELHNLVFQEPNQTLYNSKAEWEKRIAAGGFFLVCLHDDQVVGYVVCDVVESGELKIWLAGVQPEFRQQGIWSKLYAQVVSHAKAEGRNSVLLNTFPKKFPAMYAFLQSQGAEFYKTQEVDGFEKVFARIQL